MRHAAFAMHVALIGCAAPSPVRLVAVQWNVGSGGAPDATAGWTADHAAHGDAAYGNGLAWRPAVEEVTAWLATAGADVVAMQEVFDPATGCPGVPAGGPDGFRCDTWRPGDPSVFADVLGVGWQIACFPGSADKCLGVRSAHLTVDGCAGTRCDDMLAGIRVDGCGSGARVGWLDATTADGEPVRIVGLHGSSGVTADDAACRARQLDVAFAALRERPVGVLLGDANTDPVRLGAIDGSARALADHLAGGDLTLASPLTPPSYGGFVTIDHVVARGLLGGCVVPGVSEGVPAATTLALFDHHPVRCTLARAP